MFYIPQIEGSSLAEDIFGFEIREPLYLSNPLPLVSDSIVNSVFREPSDPFRIETEYIFQNREEERPILKEIKSKNGNFMQEKNIKYNLYPLYINWKKIETKSDNNVYYNIFKLFGYFGEAIFNILIDTNNNESFCTHKNFLYKLYDYKRKYTENQIEENSFMRKLLDIYDDVISLIRNKIIVFKEISVFIIVMKLYENYFLNTYDWDKVLEVLKHEFFIVSRLKDNEYKKIYNKYLKKADHDYDDYDNSEEESFASHNSKFPINKKGYINQIKYIYKNKYQITLKFDKSDERDEEV